MKNTKNTSTPRRRMGRKAVAAAGALGLGSGVAFAAVLANLEMEGQIDRGTFSAAWTHDRNSDADRGAQILVEGQDVGDLEMDGASLTLPDGVRMYAGETAVTDGLGVNSSEGGYISGLTGSVGDGWRVSIDKGCGSATKEPNSYGTAITLKVEATEAENAAPLDLSTVKVQVTKGAAPSGHSCAPLGGAA